MDELLNPESTTERNVMDYYREGDARTVVITLAEYRHLVSELARAKGALEVEMMKNTRIFMEKETLRKELEAYKA